MKSVRFGKGLTERRLRANLSRKQLADKVVGIDVTFLARLEEGYVSEIESVILENIALALGVSMRGTLTSYEQLVDLFLDVPKDERPMLIL